MATKVVEKPKVGGQASPRPPQEQMQAAYQVHTLAQMLYGQMSTLQSWRPPMLPQAASDPTTVSGMSGGVPSWGGAWAASPWSTPVGFPTVVPFTMTGFGHYPR
jgi:hypothetical protein